MTPKKTDWGVVFIAVVFVGALGTPAGLVGYFIGAAATGQWWGGAIGALISVSWLVLALENS